MEEGIESDDEAMLQETIEAEEEESEDFEEVDFEEWNYNNQVIKNFYSFTSVRKAIWDLPLNILIQMKKLSTR